MYYKNKNSNYQRKTRKPFTKGRKLYAKKKNTRIPLNPFPKTAVVKMRYCETIRLDPDASVPSYAMFSANSIYDPNRSLIGHQPYGHDTYEAIYNHYQVLKSRISVVFLPNGTSSTGNAVCGIAVKDDTTVEGNFDTIREAKGAKYAIATGDTTKCTVTNGFNVYKMFPKNVANTNANFGQNPSEEAFYQVFATGANTAVNTVSIDCVVTIEYTVKLWELKDLGTS